jgi:hypothetical protein
MAGSRSVRTVSRDDRGQAFTLEGVVAAFLVLMALLFALQSVLLTPITVGSVDESTQSRMRTQANDILRVTANNGTGDLSFYARYWSPVDRTFAGGKNPEVGYGRAGPQGPYDFGELLRQTFTERGRNYNVVLVYQLPDGNGTDSVRMVYQGEPSNSAVVATYTVTLYDDMTLTGPAASSTTLAEMDTNATNNQDGYFYAPDAVDGVVYNVIEVRLVVW